LAGGSLSFSRPGGPPSPPPPRRSYLAASGGGHESEMEEWGASGAGEAAPAQCPTRGATDASAGSGAAHFIYEAAQVGEARGGEIFDASGEVLDGAAAAAAAPPNDAALVDAAAAAARTVRDEDAERARSSAAPASPFPAASEEAEDLGEEAEGGGAGGMQMAPAPEEEEGAAAPEGEGEETAMVRRGPRSRRGSLSASGGGGYVGGFWQPAADSEVGQVETIRPILKPPDFSV